MPTAEELKVQADKEAADKLAQGQDPDEQELDDDDEPAGGDLKIALKQERDKRKAESKRVKELEASVNEMKPFVDEYKQLLPHLPNLFKKAQGEDLTKVERQAADQELVELAESLGFENEDGTPDVKRAKSLADYVTKKSGTTARTTVAPVTKQVAQAEAQRIRQNAYKVRGEDGKLYAKRDAIDKVFDQAAPEAIMNPDYAVQLLLMARGLGGPPDDDDMGEPVFTESVGRRPKAKSAGLTEMGKSIAQIRGKSEKEWEKQQDNPEETGWDLE